MSVTACSNRQVAQNVLGADSADQHIQQLYESNAAEAGQQMTRLLAAPTTGNTAPDSIARSYYAGGGQWMWMSSPAQLPLCDTLVSIIQQQVDSIGFKQDYFLASEVLPLLQQMHQPDSVQDLPATMAQLELGLTQAYLRYAVGQRYGFTQPQKLFGKANYDNTIEQPDSTFASQTFQNFSDPSALADYLQSLEPKDEPYRRLKAQLAIDSTEAQRQRTICNMERRRWRNTKTVAPGQRHIFVNIAAQQVWAIGGDSVINMRICCGKPSTKSPLLSSEINKIEINPEWGIPQSIIRGEVSSRAGDSAYFARHRYYITDGSGHRVNPRTLTSEQLRSGRYAVRQQSGAGNALGRIIFRFPNRFSVYLHDTSSPSAFNNARRTVSHGCIRLQRPFEIAEFVLPNADEWTLDQMRLSMDMKPKSQQGIDYRNAHRGAVRLISSKEVEPKVPVFIDYYTLFPNPKTGEMNVWEDPYGYDKTILTALKTYLK